MLTLGHTPLWPAILVLKNAVGKSWTKRLRGLVRYGHLTARDIAPIVSQNAETAIEFQLVRLCAVLSCTIYGPDFNRFFNEDAPYLTRLIGMLSTYMPNPHLKYSQNMTNWECERAIELTDLAGAEYIASNMKGARAYQPGWVLMARKKALQFILVIRGTVNKGDLILDLDALPKVLDDGTIVHLGMHKAALWVAEYIHQGLEAYKAAHMAKAYKLIITGHSLGAGVAMALGHHLLYTYPDIYNCTNLIAIGFGCPAMTGLNFANEARSWATNYVYDFDVISRLSLHSIQAFLKRLEVLAEDKETGKQISSRELSASVHTDSDLYVPGRIVLLQSVCASRGGQSPADSVETFSFVDEHEFAPVRGIDYERVGSREKRILATEISPHDLGEFFPGEVGFVDHGFYGYFFKQTAPIKSGSFTISL